MSTIRPGHRSALLVVDVQVGVLANAWHAAEVIASLQQAVTRARDQRVPVIWVQHEADDLARGSPEWQLVPGLQPEAGEALIAKRCESSFEATDLEALLADQGVSHIVLGGASTNWCIRATAYAALERGYDLTLLHDAHTTTSVDLGAGARLEAASVVADLNLVLPWLRYPGRRCATAAAAEVRFVESPS